jgi:hypothetical protein
MDHIVGGEPEAASAPSYVVAVVPFVRPSWFRGGGDDKRGHGQKI